MENNKDIFYRDNKYVNSDDIQFSEDYLRRVKLNRILSLSAFFAILFAGCFGIYYISTAAVTVKSSTVEYTINEDLSNLTTGTRVAYSSKPADFLEKLYIKLKLKDANTGVIEQIPNTPYQEGDRMLISKEGEYRIKCSSGLCEPNTVETIKKENILGTVK